MPDRQHPSLGMLARSLRVIVSTAMRADAKRAIGATLLFPLGAGLINVIPLWLKMTVDGIETGNLARARWGVAAVVLTFTWTAIMGQISWRLCLTLEDNAGFALQRRIVAAVTGLPTLDHFERSEQADRLEILEQAERGLSGSFYSMPMNLGYFVVAFVALMLLMVAHPLLVLLPLFALPSILIGRLQEKRQWALQHETAPLYRRVRHLFELSTAPEAGKEIRVFRLAEELRSRHRAIHLDVEGKQFRHSMWAAWGTLAGNSVFALGFVAAISFMVVQAMRGRATPGDVLMTLLIAMQVNFLVNGVIGSAMGTRSMLRLFSHVVWLEDEAKAADRDRGDAPTPSRLRHGIELRGVSFSYPGSERNALEGVDLLLPAGSTVALVGENGAGKTTLVKLLCGFYRPTAGSVHADDVDLTTVDPERWRERTAAAFQDFARLLLVIRESVGVGDVSRIDDDHSVGRALEKAGASDIPSKFPQRLETQLGTAFGGTELSGGQWQKLALGRAMMREAPLLLVLDEPTASLDAETEHALFSRYTEAARDLRESTGAITLLVSHRFSTVRSADLIVVLDQGRVVEKGTHRELLTQKGIYAQLFELQARAYR